jgi:two-component system, sensor histidine kinase
MKNNFLTSKQFIINALFGFLYYFFAINLVLNDHSRLYWMFAYFIFFLPIIYSLIKYLFPAENNTANLETPQDVKTEDVTTTEKVEPTAIESAIDKEFSLAPNNEDILELKHDFATIMSHEIKTIMTGIVGIPSMLQEKKLSKKEKTDLIDLLSHSSDNLMHVLNEMLDFSKIESGKIDLNETDFDLNESIKKIVTNKVNLYANSLENKNIKVNYGSNIDNFKYNGDKNKIEQMVSTLINNSIKFTKTGEINIIIEETEVDANDIANLKFTVKDTGSGITPEELTVIFDPYEQLRKNNKLSNSVVGLAVLRNYVNLMGGDINIASTKNVGTEVSFNLKLIKAALTTNNLITKNPNNPDEIVSPEEAEMMAAMMGEATSTLEEKPTEEEPIQLKSEGYVLIAEDNKANQKFLEILLNKIGIKYKFVTDGQDAFDIFTNEYCYDLILMDTDLPYIDGIEASKMIREWEKQYEKKPIPIIAITANTSILHTEDCKEAGMNGFIHKPIHIKEVRDSLSKYLVVN